MALISCYECKKPVSTEAAACPHCGAKPKSSGPSGCGIAALIIGAGFVVFIIIAASVDSPDPTSRAAPAQAAAKAAPSVSLAISAHELEVTNDGTSPWPEMTIYLNEVPGGFKLITAAPAVGAKVRVELSRFVDKRGNRYNPALHGVTSIWIGGSGRDFEQHKVR